jgi:hypothetical protein
MTLQSSGVISMGQINTEFGRGLSLRGYCGTGWFTDAGDSGTFTTGAIKYSDFYGKRLTSPSINLTITANSQNVNLYTLAGSPAGAVVVNLTINSGVYCYASNTSNYGLRTGAFVGGSVITITVNGFITGMGGDGSDYYYTTGTAGGPAFFAEQNCIINGTGQINGGGGGGGAGGGNPTPSFGGGGGGRSFLNSLGLAGGEPGTVNGGGAGGGGYYFGGGSEQGASSRNNGGAGGNWGEAGGDGLYDGLSGSPGQSGLSGGASINRNGRTVTTSGVTLNGVVIG